MDCFKKLALAVAVSSVAVITGCGGSGGGSSNNGGDTDTTTQTNTETGVFVDSAVVGINYATSPSGQEGQTNELGEYDYAPGDTVTFSIGGIELPPVEATGRVTPADMGSGATDWSTDQTVVNILRLLQTLDDDGNPANGITITNAIHTALQDVDIDPTVSESDFETQASTAITATGKTLVAKADAINHFKASQSADLTGSWVYVEDGGNMNVLTFLNNSEYLIVHSKADDDQQTAGSGEHGTYLWDSASGELSLTRVGDSDGSGGLAGNNATATWTMQLKDGSLVLNSSDASEEVTFDAIRNDRNSLVGSWYLGEGEGVHNVLTILDDSTYVIAHNANEEGYDAVPVAVSSEWGSYTYGNGNFAVSNVTVDLDGPGGLFDDPARNNGNGPVNGPAILHPTGELTLTDNASAADTFTLQRLGRHAIELRDFEGDTTPLYVESELYPGTPTPDTVYFTFADLLEGGEAGTFDLTFSPSLDITVDMRTDNGSRLGTMSFDGSGEDNIAGEWDISTSGTLVFTETDGSDGDYGHWRFVQLDKDQSGEVLVYLDGVGSLELMFITDLYFDGPAL
ncbi:hypothetical protein [Marinobacter arenosus]|uniref:hypothetical protein n=1 Tax=Marinobacter arenosus TaxID=2856822 RepID=UPI001C4C938D|nr:hypothetical protein [Marinobacter arenosus]MBW0147155.1 hypothetical protein [Marinobacter arenosus]